MRFVAGDNYDSAADYRVPGRAVHDIVHSIGRPVENANDLDICPFDLHDVSAGHAVCTISPWWSWWPFVTLWSGRPGRSLITLRSRRTRRSLVTLWSRWARRSFIALRSRRPGRSFITLWSRRTRLALWTSDALSVPGNNVLTCGALGAGKDDASRAVESIDAGIDRPRLSVCAACEATALNQREPEQCQNNRCGDQQAKNAPAHSGDQQIRTWHPTSLHHSKKNLPHTVVRSAFRSNDRTKQPASDPPIMSDLRRCAL